MANQEEIFNELQRKKLIIQTFLIFKDLQNEEPIEITKSIKRFFILRNEFPSIKPIYKYEVSLSTEVISKINKSKDWFIETKIYFNKNSGKAFHETQNNTPIKYLVRDLKLKPYLYPEIKKQDNFDDVNIEYFIEAFEETHFYTNVKSAEIRLKDSTVKQALIYLINFYAKDLKLTKIIVNKIDNEETYNEIQIPEGGFFDSLKFLDEKYGIFEQPASFFIENNIFYCINKCKKNDYGIVVNHRNDLLVVFANYEDLSKDFAEENHILNNDNYFISNNTDFIGREIGNSVNFFTDDFKTVKSSQEVLKPNIDKTSINTQIVGKEKSLFGSGIHNIFMKQRLEEKLKPKIRLTCKFRHCNITDHNFNTQYKIEFNDKNDKRYNGLWISNKSSIICEFDEEQEFSARLEVELKKIN